MRRHRRLAARGFTLLEAMISLMLLVIVLIVAMTMLFQMRAFAERQQYFMLPRQAARRATDYLSYYVAGASDLNNPTNTGATALSPNALITYYNLNGVLTQASYNNLGCPDSTGSTTCTEPGNGSRVIPANPPAIPTAIASTKFGDIGTDIITLVTPFSPARYQISPPFPALGSGRDLSLNFRVGCASGDAANLAAFQAATGFDGTQSALLLLVDSTQSWSYVRIPSAGYKTDGLCSDLSATPNNIHITVDTKAVATLPEPPHGVAVLTDPVYLVAGLQVISFRVLTDSVDGIPKLQQKLGLFDPKTDNPGTDFTNVMENVEDLQVAYMYRDGGIWNTATPTGSPSRTISTAATTVAGALGCPQAACANGVPFQAGTNFGAVAPPLDAANVIGLRFSVTGRSPLLPLGARQLTNVDVKGSLATTASQHFRPSSEDHLATDPPKFDQYDHYRATATLLLRNRTPGG